MRVSATSSLMCRSPTLASPPVNSCHEISFSLLPLPLSHLISEVGVGGNWFVFSPLSSGRPHSALTVSGPLLLERRRAACSAWIPRSSLTEVHCPRTCSRLSVASLRHISSFPWTPGSCKLTSCKAASLQVQLPLVGAQFSISLSAASPPLQHISPRSCCRERHLFAGNCSPTRCLCARIFLHTSGGPGPGCPNSMSSKGSSTPKQTSIASFFGARAKAGHAAATADRGIERKTAGPRTDSTTVSSVVGPLTRSLGSSAEAGSGVPISKCSSSSKASGEDPKDAGDGPESSAAGTQAGTHEDPPAKSSSNKRGTLKDTRLGGEDSHSLGSAATAGAHVGTSGNPAVAEVKSPAMPSSIREAGGEERKAGDGLRPPSAKSSKALGPEQDELAASQLSYQKEAAASEVATAAPSGDVRKFFVQGSRKIKGETQESSHAKDSPVLGEAGLETSTLESPGEAVVGKQARVADPLSSSDSGSGGEGGVLGKKRKKRRTRNGKRCLVMEDDDDDDEAKADEASRAAGPKPAEEASERSLAGVVAAREPVEAICKAPPETAVRSEPGKVSKPSGTLGAMFKRKNSEKEYFPEPSAKGNQDAEKGAVTKSTTPAKRGKRDSSPQKSSPPQAAPLDVPPASSSSTSGGSGLGDEEEGEEGSSVLVVEEEESAMVAAPRASKGAKGKGAQVTRTKYDAREGASWKGGQPVPFVFLADLLERISKESGRLAITEMLCNALRTVMLVTPSDILPVLYLAANRVAPPHEGVELGIGDATIIKALAEATGRKEQQVKAEYKECGDLGLVAKASRTTQRTMMQPKPLTVRGVFDAFRAIAKETGSQSNDKKRNRIKQLLVSARNNEPQFIVRLLQGKMRIGLAEQTVLAALAQAAVYHMHDTSQGLGEANGAGEEGGKDQESAEGGVGDGSAQLEKGAKNAFAVLKKHSTRVTPEKLDQAVTIMKQVYSVLPVYEHIVPILLDPEQGIWRLQERCRFTLGVPVGPMLAKPTKGISEILDKFQGKTFTCEYKYDGERAQIHCREDGTVEVYSRNAERNTTKYPDVVQAVLQRRKEGVKSFVLDAEAVAYDREKERILPFQVLSTRARKGVAEEDIKVRVCVFAFDLLALNGQDLLQEQLKRRRELLYESFTEAKGEFQFATATTSSDTEELMAFVNDAVAHGCEGAMVKTLEEDATYEPAKRSNNWLKLKKDYMEGLGDSLDLVPIGGFLGRGKRAGVYGAFLLACYDPDREEYQSICKIGTGFSEAVLEERSASLRQQVVDAPFPYFRYGETLPVDVWFKPSEVWEVRAADLSISPVHQAARGLVDESKGIALRFPRFLRVREDKSVELATTAEQVADMFRAQSQHAHKD